MKTFSAVLEGRDELYLELDESSGGSARLRVVGCPDLLTLVQTWRPKLQGSAPERWPLPEGEDHASMLLREVILKARGQWAFPYAEAELCHCRAVPTAKVDAAIVGGAHSVSAVSRRTSAGTSCGTCQTDIKSVLVFRRAKAGA